MATKVTGWFPHDIDAVHDVAIQMLVDEHGATGYGVWWRTVELLHEHNGRVRGEHLIFLLYRSLECDVETVADVVDTAVTVGLLQRDDSEIWSERVLRNIEQRNDIMGKRSESGRRGGMAKASKALANAKQVPSKSQASAKQLPSKPLANSSTYTVTDTVREDNTPLPPFQGGVLDYPEFRDAWAEWERHRHGLKKPMTETSAKRQIVKLEAIKAKGGDPVAWLYNAIEKGWRGLFAPPDRPTFDDVLAWFEKHYAQDQAEAEALKFYSRYDAVNWRVAGQDVTNWKALAVSWKENKL